MNTETTHLKIYFIVSLLYIWRCGKNKKIKRGKKVIFLNSLNKSTLKGKDCQLPTSNFPVSTSPSPNLFMSQKKKTKHI